MIIIVEGPDGAGKTTIAKKLAQVFSYKYYHFGVPKNEDTLFYDRLNFLQTHDNCVIDRFWPSDQVYGTVMRGKTPYSIEQIQTLAWYKKNETIMLYCTDDAEVLWDVLQERGEDYIQDEETYKAIHAGYVVLMEDLSITGTAVHKVIFEL